MSQIQMSQMLTAVAASASSVSIRTGIAISSLQPPAFSIQHSGFVARIPKIWSPAMGFGARDLKTEYLGWHVPP